MNVQALPMNRFIDQHGQVVKPLPEWADVTTLKKFYRDMVVARTYDNKAVALQRTGKLGTYPSHLGAEAFGIAIGHAMKPQDVFVPYYRDMLLCGFEESVWKKTFSTGVAMSEAVTLLLKIVKSGVAIYPLLCPYCYAVCSCCRRCVCS